MIHSQYLRRRKNSQQNRKNSIPHFIEIPTSRLKDHVGIENSPNMKNDSRLIEDKELLF